MTLAKIPEELLNGSPSDPAYQPKKNEMRDFLEQMAGEPIIVGFFGASGMAGSANNTAGNRTIRNGTALWNSSSISANYVTGSQFNPPAFGTAPLDRLDSGGVEYANSQPLQIINELQLQTGRPVYGVVCAMGGHATEAFITDATLTANSWTRDAGDEDMTAHYTNLATAIAAVPNTTKTHFDYVCWFGTSDIDTAAVQNSATTQGRYGWQKRFEAIWSDMAAAGIIDDDKTRIVASHTAPGRNAYWIHAHAISDARSNVKNLVTVSTQGLAAPVDGIHFDGESQTELARRYAAACMGGGEAPNRMLVLSNSDNADDQASFVIDQQTGNKSLATKFDDTNWIEVEWNSNSKNVKINWGDYTDSYELFKFDREGETTALEISAYREGSNYNNAGVVFDAPRSGDADGANTGGRGMLAMLGNSASTDAGPLWLVAKGTGADPADTDATIKTYGGYGLRLDQSTAEFWRNNVLRLKIGNDEVYFPRDLRVGQDTTDTPGNSGNTTVGAAIQLGGDAYFSADDNNPLSLNRNTGDGRFIRFNRDGTLVGDITVSSGTVSLTGAHLSRVSQLSTANLPEGRMPDGSNLLLGTVMSNRDDMCWFDRAVIDTKTGKPKVKKGTKKVTDPETKKRKTVKTEKVITKLAESMQLNRTVVSDLIEDRDIAGVFEHWDEDHPERDFKIAQSGDYVIRIHPEKVVKRGDLLCSNGDGTARAQTDDTVKSSTIAKVTSNKVVGVHPDGSYLVPCVLMVC